MEVFTDSCVASSDRGSDVYSRTNQLAGKEPGLRLAPEEGTSASATHVPLRARDKTIHDFAGCPSQYEG